MDDGLVAIDEVEDEEEDVQDARDQEVYVDYEDVYHHYQCDYRSFHRINHSKAKCTVKDAKIIWKFVS